MTRSRLLPALFVCLLVAFGGAPVHAQSSDDERASPDATVYVDGLACPFCAYGIEKKLNTLDDVQKMEVQLEEGRILLAFKEGASLAKEDLQEAVQNAGFTARKIEFSEEASPESPSL
jgi:mercuric ion binding protein